MWISSKSLLDDHVEAAVGCLQKKIENAVANVVPV